MSTDDNIERAMATVSGLGWEFADLVVNAHADNCDTLEEMVVLFRALIARGMSPDLVATAFVHGVARR